MRTKRRNFKKIPLGISKTWSHDHMGRQSLQRTENFHGIPPHSLKFSRYPLKAKELFARVSMTSNNLRRTIFQNDAQSSYTPHASV